MPDKVLKIEIFVTINFFSVSRPEKYFSICEHKKNIFIGGSEFRGFLYSIVLRRMAIQNPKKIPMIFMCESCDYNTSNKKDYTKHILTSKHQNAIKGYTEATSQNPCICGKKFRHSSSLYRHKNICVLPHDKHIEPNADKVVEEPDHTIVSDQSLMSFLIKQNQEFKDMIVEQNKTIVDAIKKCSSSISNSTVNSNNKTFNLQVFLNEDCKDAMNITDFVNSINFQLSDLEHMGQVGYVEGISNIIIKNLKALDVTKRPVHCTDPKRETIYIKDGGVWEKDDEDNKKLRKMIKSVAFRNSKTTKLFKEKYPDCNQGDSKYSDIYNKIVIEAMGGGSKCNDRDSEDKIIRKIAKVMTIDKS
jgi:hypothetical protein